MEHSDVRPPPLSAFFARLGYRDELPLTPEEAVALLKNKRVRIDEPVAAVSTDPRGRLVIEARAVEYADGVGERAAPDGGELTVRPGECPSLVGAHGSGTTT